MASGYSAAEVEAFGGVSAWDGMQGDGVHHGVCVGRICNWMGCVGHIGNRRQGLSMNGRIG